MSYVVFALKWRPQKFDEIVGQSQVVDKLAAAINRNRVAHAYLFSGPRGVGKTSTARILAKALNCKDGPTLSPCGKCPSCVDIGQARSLDVIEIDGASNRGIDEIRTLRENVKFAPVSGKFKIYIIDEVHMLTTEAFNALLKTLEEPPEFVKFIFATTQPNKVLPTILSRCQRLDFRRIPAMETVVQLEKICKKEDVKLGKEVLFAIAKSSDGSLRDAESVLDQLLAFSRQDLSLQEVVSLLGLVEQEALFEITDCLIRKDPLGALRLLNSVIDNGKDTGLFLNNLIEHFRNLMVAKITNADTKLIDMPPEICERLMKQAVTFKLEEIFAAFNTLVSAQEMSKRMDSFRIPLEISLVKLAHDGKSSFPQYAHAAHPHPVEEKPTAVKEHKKEDAIDPKVEVEESGGSITMEEIENSWNNVIVNLGKIKMAVATYMNEAKPLKIVNNVLTVSLPKNCSFHKNSLERKENKEIIEKALSELLHNKLRVNFLLSQEEAAKEDTETTPFIKSALEAFKGRVIR